MRVKKRVRCRARCPNICATRITPAQVRWTLEHGTGYKYPHDYPGGWVQQQYMPDELIGHKYYFPKDIGAEKALYNKQKN